MIVSPSPPSVTPRESIMDWSLAVADVVFVVCPVRGNNSKAKMFEKPNFGGKLARVVCNPNTQLEVKMSKGRGHQAD